MIHKKLSALISFKIWEVIQHSKAEETISSIY